MLVATMGELQYDAPQQGPKPAPHDDADRRVLSTIIDKFNGGPVGLQTIAASISEEADTVMDVVEPYLLQLGFIDRTPQGRVATPRAYEHLKLTPPTPKQQPRLPEI